MSQLWLVLTKLASTQKSTELDPFEFSSSSEVVDALSPTQTHLLDSFEQTLDVEQGQVNTFRHALAALVSSLRDKLSARIITTPAISSTAENLWSAFLAPQAPQTPKIEQLAKTQETSTWPSITNLVLYTFHKHYNLLPLCFVYSPQSSKSHLILLARLSQFSELVVAVGLNVLGWINPHKEPGAGQSKTLNGEAALAPLLRTHDPKQPKTYFIPCKMALESRVVLSSKSSEKQNVWTFPDWHNLYAEIDNFLFLPLGLLSAEILQSTNAILEL